MKFQKIVSGIMAFAMMSALAVPNTFAATDTTAYNVLANGGTVQFEDLVSTGKVANTGENNGDSIWIAEKVDGDRYNFDLSFTAESEGMYKFDLGAAVYGTGESGNEFLSEVYYRVNDDTEYKVGEWTQCKTIDLGYKANTSHNVKEYDQFFPVYLKKGENKIRFSIGRQSNNPQNTARCAAFDYMKFTPIDNNKITAAEGKTAVLEIEDFEGWSVSNGAFHMDGGAISSHTIKTSMFAEKDGWYSIDIVAACDVTFTGISPLGVQVNGGNIDKLKSDNCTVTDPDSTGNAAYALKHIAYKPKVFLNAGKNDITLHLYSRQSDNTMRIKLDKVMVNLTKSLATLPAAGGKVDFLNMTGETASVKNSSDESLIYFFQSGIDSYTMSFKLNAEKSGWYYMDMTGSCSTASEWLSPVTMKINSSKFNLSLNKVDVTTTDAGYNSSNNFKMQKYAMAKPVYLNKGENTINASITKRNAGGCYALFEDLTFTPVEIPTITENVKNIKIEAEDFDRAHASLSAEEKNVVRYNGDGLDFETIDMVVNANESGYYKLGVDGWFNWGGIDYISKLGFSVNDGTEIILDKNSNLEITTDNTSKGGWYVSETQYNKNIKLNKGENKIILTMHYATPDSKKVVQGIVDCITLTSVDYPKVSATGTTRLEFETQSEKEAFEETNASGELYVLYDNEIGTQASETLTFMVSKAGEYTLDIIGAFNMSDEDLSKVKISVNGSEAEELTATGENSNAMKDGDDLFEVESLDMDGLSYNFAKYAYLKKLNLNEGINEITFSIVPIEADGDNFLCAGFDCIDLTAAKAVVPSEIEIADSIKAGNTADIKVKDSEGLEIANADVYQITYETNNDSAATVDGNGRVTAKNAGTATITVKVYVNQSDSNPYTFTQKVYTVTESGVYIKDASVSNGAVSAKAVFTNENVTTGKVLVAVYNGTALKEVKEATLGTDGTISASLTKYEADNSVKIIVVGTSDIKPLWCATAL